MEYMSVIQAAKEWGISERRVRLLCSQNLVEGAVKKKNKYMIPYGTMKPTDRRFTIAKRKTRVYEEMSEIIDLIKTCWAYDYADQNFLSCFIYGHCVNEYDDVLEEDVRMIVNGIIPRRMRLNEVLKIQGCKDALEYICAAAKQKSKLSTESIAEANSYLFMNNPEKWLKFRTKKIESKNRIIKFEEPEEVQRSLTKLIVDNTMRKRTIFEFDCAAIMYMDFLRIMPFEDKNEVTAQLLLDYELIKMGFPPIVFTTNEMKDRYYNGALETYYFSGDWTRMAALIAKKIIGRINEKIK